MFAVTYPNPQWRAFWHLADERLRWPPFRMEGMPSKAGWKSPKFRKIHVAMCLNSLLPYSHFATGLK